LEPDINFNTAFPIHSLQFGGNGSLKRDLAGTLRHLGGIPDFLLILKTKEFTLFTWILVVNKGA